MTDRAMTLFAISVMLLGSVTMARMAGGQPQSQTSPPIRVDVAKLGPQVGERVPDFSLNDQSGKAWTLRSIMGPKGAMLVFYRSADW